MARNLYLVKSRGFRSYVVAENTEEAWQKFSSWLKEKEYGFYADRDFESIEIVAKEDEHSPKSNTGMSFDDSRQDDKLFF